MPKTEEEAKAELTGYFFLDVPVPEKYWLDGEPLDFTDQYHCLHLIREVRRGMPRTME